MIKINCYGPLTKHKAPVFKFGIGFAVQRLWSNSTWDIEKEESTDLYKYQIAIGILFWMIGVEFKRQFPELST